MRGLNKLKLSVVLAATLSLTALLLPVCAAGNEAIGNFRTENTESARTEETSPATEEENLISLSDSVGYSPDSQLFYRSVEGSRFGISVPDGAIVTDGVRIELAPTLRAVLYKNGIELNETDLGYITDPGKYVLAVTANDASQTVRVNFTIISSPTGKIKEYKMPTDFFIVSATLDGEDASYSQSYIDLRRDGDYVINYRSPAANKDYRLCVTIDHTAPTATLSGIVDGKANEPVVVSDLESGARVYLERNGKPISYSDTISETGAYVLTVQDEAGNETVYDFVVVTYANGSLKLLAAMILLLITALAGYLLYYRKFIRVS